MKKMSTRHSEETEKIREMERERRNEMERRFQEEKKSITRRNEENMAEIKKRREEEREEWRLKTIKQLEEEKRNELEDMKKSLLLERDEQIDLVIRRLDEETGATNRAAAANFQRRTEEMERDHEDNVRALRSSESTWMDKVTQMTKTHEVLQGRLDMAGRRADDEERRRVELDAELSECRREIHTKISSLRKEHAEARMEDVRRQESLERAVLQMERKLEESSDEREMAIADERRRRSNELDQVHGRVRQTILKKDEMIHRLQDELETSLMKTEHATMLLEKQRRELLEE